jgi:hypothetical protein
MAKHKTPEDDDSGDTSQVEKAVEEQLPGWKVVAPHHARPGETDTPRRAAQGASVADLRRKFIGPADGDEGLRKKFLGSEESATDEGAEGDEYPSLDESVRVFRVEPVDGGPARVAELRGGKIKLVSG